VDAAVASLIGKDRNRDITTHYVHVDEPAHAKRYGFEAVTGQPTAGKCKAVVDALFASLSPDYLVLLGAPDVIPQFEVDNPTYQGLQGDVDQTVPTDNPYACSQPFRRNDRKTYLIPDRVAGRIPDLPGSKDPSWLLDYLTQAESWTIGVSKQYAGDLFVCCDEWKGAGRACVSYLSRAADRLMISPPILDTSPALRSRHKAPLHMIKCHGQSLSATFSGQKGNSFPAALVSTSLDKRTAARAVVGAMCCYGAAVFDPQDPAALQPGAPSIPSVYLKQGTYGFVGSTTIAWVGVDVMQCADWIVASWLRSVLRGASLGRALLEAKQDLFKFLAQQGETPGLAEEKTLLQFQLLGDPAIHILPLAEGTPAVVPAARRVAAVRMAAAPVTGAGTAEERRARRAYRHETARQLRGSLPVRRVIAPPAPRRRAAAGVRGGGGAAGAEATFRRIASAMKGVTFGAPLCQRLSRPVVQPELVPAAARRVAVAGKRLATPQASDETIEYYWIRRDVEAERRARGLVVAARLIKVETDPAGQVIRSKVLVSC
jgi:Peptidase family C25